MPFPKENTYTRDELLDAIRELTAILHRPPTLREMDKDKLVPSAFTFKYRFPSWRAAVKEALGDEVEVPNARGPADLAKLHEDMLRLAAQLGRPPTVRELAAVRSAHHPNTYIRRFGSWRAAQRQILGVRD